MAFSYRIWDFPVLHVKQQLFYVPGAAYEGGFTSGGARVYSPEPASRSFLEVQISLQVNETANPISSWLMSKSNSDIFRVSLVKTPQLCIAENSEFDKSGLPWSTDTLLPDDIDFPESPWNHNLNWLNDAFIVALSPASEGSVFIESNLNVHYGQFLMPGHVIGHKFDCYMIENIEVIDGTSRILINPPLRRNVEAGDFIKLTPVFTGTIANGNEVRNSYDIANNRHIQLNKIVFQEAIIT
jgi:hypothetical protein